MKYRVLISEDEPGLTMVYQKELEWEGRFQVEVALDGLKAESLIETIPFDVVLLDLMTPKVAGGELLKKIKATQPWTPCIIVSGKGTEKDKLEALNEHAFKYLEKPASMEKITEAIEEALGSRELVLKVVEKMVRESQNPQEPVLKINGQVFSAQTLFDAVRLGTPEGMRYRQEFKDFVVERGGEFPLSDSPESDQPFRDYGLMDC